MTLFAVAGVLAACASAPASRGPNIESVPGQPGMVRLVLDKEDAFRLSRAGVMDPSSPSGLTDRFRYRAAVESYTAAVLKDNGLCPNGFGDLSIEGTVITVVCAP
jgi:hypothetical protein